MVEPLTCGTASMSPLIDAKCSVQQLKQLCYYCQHSLTAINVESILCFPILEKAKTEGPVWFFKT